MLKFLLAGFTINLLTSIDDAMTRIPVLSANTRTIKGRLAFSFGNLLAVTLAIFIAYVLSQFLASIPESNTIVALLIFVLAGVIYFDLLALKPPKKVQAEIKQSQISNQRLTKLVGLGFVMAFITMVDDMFALAPLFLHGEKESFAAIVGIYAASLILIFIVIFFSEKLSSLPRKREIATVTLVIFGLLLLSHVI